MPSDINSLIIELRKAFSSNKGLVLTREGLEPTQVIPMSLGLDKDDRPSLGFKLLTENSPTQEVLLNDVSAVMVDDSIVVPDSISSSQDYWQSRFFSYHPATTAPSPYGPRADLAASAIINPYAPKIGHTTPEDSSFEHFPTEPPQELSSPAFRPQAAEGHPQNAFTQGTPNTAQIFPATPKKKAGKTAVVSMIVAGVLVLGVSGTLIVSSTIARTGGTSTASNSSDSDDSSVSSEEDYEKWMEEASAWDASEAYEKQITSTDGVFAITDSPKLNDYDHLSWAWPLAEFDDESGYAQPEDRMPEGWTIDYSSATGMTTIPMPNIENDPKGEFDRLVYKSSTADLVAGNSILSKSKIAELGGSDEEATRALMTELVSSTATSEPVVVKIYDTSNYNSYTEFYEYTYTDLKGVEVHYALRVFVNSGKVLALANNAGWATETLPDNGFTFSLYAYPSYPMDEERQAD